MMSYGGSESSWNLKLVNSARLASWKAPGSSCLCLPGVLITGAQFYMGAEEPKFLMSVLQILCLLRTNSPSPQMTF